MSSDNALPTAARTTLGRRAGKLAEVKISNALTGLTRGHRTYLTESGCSVICSRDPARAAPAGMWLPPSELLLWHVSIAHEDRYPEWDEIADVRYALVPDDVTMALLLPPLGEYVNTHEMCFHLWQIDDRRDER
jgi:hypothetical protein